MNNNQTSIGTSILDYIDDDAVWLNYIENKLSDYADDSEIQFFIDMYNDGHCRSMCKLISEGRYIFSVPQKMQISKNHGNKKRTVYRFNKKEMAVLKILAYELHEYDWLFSPCLYSFRRHICAANAVKKLFETKNFEKMWGFKADVHNYFNSINTDRLLHELHNDLSDDKLFSLFKGILSDSRVLYRGEIKEEQKGVMAGIPISAFLANYYLKNVDEYFDSLDCLYMRYADDILILAHSKEQLLNLRNKLIEMVTERGLVMNPDKELFFEPGQKFEFLGFDISADCIDISSNTMHKMKGKIRRSARSIRRWMIKKNAPIEGTIRALIREYNRRFYGYESGELSWSAWYFSTITTTKSLHEIDHYFQEWARYVATGRHNKKNYDIISYETLKSCGYRPLVSEYYNRKSQAQT